MIFAALLALALGSFVDLNTSSLRMAHRSFYAAEAVNMAEAGLEEAIWSFNQAQAGDTAAWQGWNTSDGVKATRTFTDFNLGANASGCVKVHVDHYNPGAGVQPTVVAKATVTQPHGPADISRLLEMKLKRRSLFAAGIVAKNNIDFSGNSASVDSWNSDPDNNAATAAVPFGLGVRRDKGSVAAMSVTASIWIGNADIWGTASVGGPSASAISLGHNGVIGSFGTANGVKDPASIATDFTANLDPVITPSGGTVLASLGSTLGADGTTTLWRTQRISEDLTVHGHVTLVLTAGSGVEAISLTGHDGITLAAGATLSIYVEGDVKLGGNGLLNPNAQPLSVQIWGTNASPMGQTIKIAGNGALKAIVYAPNASVEIRGNGDVMGAIVAEDVSLTGNASFHYDESLANWGVNTPYGVVKWREIASAADRAMYVTRLSF
jgi:hypothetical protein